MLPVLPFGLVQLSLTASTTAPAKPAGGVTASAARSVPCSTQVPLPRLVPALRLQPAGTPAMVTATDSPVTPEGSVNAKLVWLPAAPAGLVSRNAAEAVPPVASHAVKVMVSACLNRLVVENVKLRVVLAAKTKVAVPRGPM